jgi:methylphosphotriester-DNA--protein-cysteine methyltransferase
MIRGRGCRAPSPTRRREEVVVRTLEEVPAGATHWSKRELARRVGLSPSSVLRIWHAFGLQPRRTETFKISRISKPAH